MSEATLPTRAAITVALLSSAYVAAQLLSDIGSLKITEFMGLSVDAGTLIYPLTFTIRDLIHKAAGVTVARTMIFAAAGLNLFMALFFWLVGELPVVAESGLPSELFADVLSPIWRIVWASIIAEVVAELIDTEVYQGWVSRFGDRHQWGRVLSSNAVAIPIDSAIFVLIAFGGVLSSAVLWEIFTTNLIVKFAVTIASIPLIYVVKPIRVVADPAPV